LVKLEIRITTSYSNLHLAKPGLSWCDASMKPAPTIRFDAEPLR